MAGRRDVDVFATFCESHTSQVPFHAVARLLRGTTGVDGLDGQTARDRLRDRYEPAATITGFAYSQFTAEAQPEINIVIAHLRDVLGDQTYEPLAHKGEMMTTAAMVAYAYDQIDQARAELNAVSK